jgi:hypothetical protein
MRYELVSPLVAICLFTSILAMHQLGRWLSQRGWGSGRRATDGEGAFGIIDGAVFGLLGLLIAFTFSGAAGRFDERRKLIVDEANAIGTAYLRIDLVSPAHQAGLRETMRRYLDARLAAYRALPDLAAARVQLVRSQQLQTQLWQQAVAAVADTPSSAVLLMPALNEVFDIATTRSMATQIHPPRVIFVLLFAFALLSALIAGHASAGSGGRHWLHSGVFAFVLAGAVYVIIDMEYPRLGFIRVDAFDQALVDVRDSMK